MKRFASLATTAALAGSLIGAGTAAQAVSTITLVPGSGASLANTYVAGDVINVSAIITLGTSSFGSFSVPTAVGYLNSQFDDPAGGDYGADSNAKFVGPKAGTTGGTATYQLWSLNSPNVSTPTTGKVNGETVQSVQAVPGHSNTVVKINNVSTTLAVPAGTYTLATFAFTVASTYVSGPLTLYLTTPNGFANAANDADGAFAGGAPTNSINGKSPAGAAVSESLIFAPGTTTLTFNPGAVTPPVPAPSSLIVVAMGAIPAIGVLRRRRAVKK